MPKAVSYPRQPKLPLKLHRRHARRLAGDHIGSPKPRAQRRVAALHDRADGQSRLAAASATGQDARPRGDAERFTHDAAVRAGEPVTPASFFQVGGAGRIVGEKSLKLRERSREWQVGSVENVHGSLSASRTQSILVGVCVKRIGTIECIGRPSLVVSGWWRVERHNGWYYGGCQRERPREWNDK